MIRFIHTADIHFGMENYGRIDPKTGIHSRLGDFFNAVNFCVDIAIKENVDFFLFSGDAYKTAHPSQTQQKLLFECFIRLYKAQIPIVIVIGNHDNPLSFGKAHALDIFGTLPLSGFHVIAKPTILPLQTKQGLVNIVGIPWPTRNTIAINNKHADQSTTQLTQYISRAVVSIIKSFAEQLDPTVPAVLAGHLTVANGIFSGSEKRAVYGTDPLFLPSELAIKPFDYVALGHLHRYQNLMPDGYPAVVYAGSPERIDFGERNDQKGFCLVTIEQKGKTSHEFIKTPTRPFVQIDVVLQQKDLPFTQQIINAIAQKTIDQAVVKIIYHLPSGSSDAVDIKAVQLACQKAHHIAAIVPKKAIEVRQSRSNTFMGAQQDLPSLMAAYCSTKPTLQVKKDLLVDLTKQLIEEHEKMQEERQQSTN